MEDDVSVINIKLSGHDKGKMKFPKKKPCTSKRYKYFDGRQRHLKTAPYKRKHAEIELL